MTVPRLFASLLVLLATWPAGAEPLGRFFVEPMEPVDTGPTRVTFLSNNLEALAFALPLVERDGQTIRVTTGFGDYCAFPCPIYRVLVTADLGLLPAGTYRVEIWVDKPDPRDRREGEASMIYFDTLVVAPGPEPPVEAILQHGRFEVSATWQTAAGEEGEARLVQPPSTDSALFYFFDRSNWELMVKVLDGCAINGHYWVFAAASTDVAFQATVKEAGGRTFEIGNRLGQPAAAINSITAFSCF